MSGTDKIVPLGALRRRPDEKGGTWYLYFCDPDVVAASKAPPNGLRERSKRMALGILSLIYATCATIRRRLATPWKDCG